MNPIIRPRLQRRLPVTRAVYSVRPSTQTDYAQYGNTNLWSTTAMDMLKKVIAHEKTIEIAIKQMPARAAFAFAFACTERQWPVFERSMTDVASMSLSAAHIPNVLDFRKAIDFGWDYCINGTPIPYGFSAACGREISNIDDNAAASAIFTISNSIVGLLDSIEETDEDYTFSLPDKNFALIELLLIQYGPPLRELTENQTKDSPEVKRIRLLITEEMKRQQVDLQALNTIGS